ncbi:hypothetical protein B9479_005595 [Cryptococcus floricola]|uniref:Uncharacterized protein n=1 Tax=Cryptococcus floricola TaxID=2591691 RepID=A0A5D3AVC0_9TREE|nr:hypothetical protein B9479_005595 [Cryptococcus floricola]
MSYFDGAPTGATGLDMTSFEYDDEELADLELEVDPMLPSYWYGVTTDQLQNMPDGTLEWTRKQWQRFTQASNLNNTSIDIDSGCRALLENSIEVGVLTEASGASASGPLEPSVRVTSAQETSSLKKRRPLTSTERSANWRRRKMEEDPNFADKGASFTSSSYAAGSPLLIKLTSSLPEKKRRHQVYLKKKSLKEKTNATEHTESQDEDAEGESE